MLNRKQIFDAITNDGKRDIAGTEVQSIINRLMDLQSQNLQQTPCTAQLPTLEDAWNAGVDEGMDSAHSFEWGTRRKGVQFSDWYKAELEYRSSGQ